MVMGAVVRKYSESLKAFHIGTSVESRIQGDKNCLENAYCSCHSRMALLFVPTTILDTCFVLKSIICLNSERKPTVNVSSDAEDSSLGIIDNSSDISSPSSDADTYNFLIACNTGRPRGIVVF